MGVPCCRAGGRAAAARPDHDRLSSSGEQRNWWPGLPGTGPAKGLFWVKCTTTGARPPMVTLPCRLSLAIMLYSTGSMAPVKRKYLRG